MSDRYGKLFSKKSYMNLDKNENGGCDDIDDNDYS